MVSIKLFSRYHNRKALRLLLSKQRVGRVKPRTLSKWRGTKPWRKNLRNFGVSDKWIPH
jgi:hypothetical protein